MKISIIGAGMVGSTTAFALIERGLCDELVLVDVVTNKVLGESLDLRHCVAALKKSVKITGTDDYSLTKNSDLTIITAGMPRKPGESRLDLAKKNATIMKDIISKIHKDGMIFVVSNPVDVMTYLALKLSGLDKSRVFGLGTMLDTTRLRSMLAEKYNKNLNAFVIGEHGDSMLPVFSKIGGGYYVKELEKVFEEVRFSAAEVIRLKGATWFAPALAVTEVVESVVKDKKSVLPLSVYFEKYGVCIGYPCIVGKKGIVPADFKLNKNEEETFLKSVEVLKEVTSNL